MQAISEIEKLEQMEQMWTDHERGSERIYDYFRKRYRGKPLDTIYRILCRTDRRGAALFRFVRNDPVADYEEVADVVALID